jgi:autoinducer 2-degrading protein
MLVVMVHVSVKAEHVDAFIEKTRANAEASLEEPGIARFDVVQNKEQPTRFVLLEVYRTDEDPGRHKETAHYQRWRDDVEPMMAEPRRSEKYRDLAPPPAGWETPR